MATQAIIEDFDVLENISTRFSPCSVIPTMNPLPFEQGKETFRHGIIITIPRPTHATRDPLVPQMLLEVIAGILTPSIRVMN